MDEWMVEQMAMAKSKPMAMAKTKPMAMNKDMAICQHCS